MKILVDNVDLTSTSGPNSFGKQFVNALSFYGHNVIDFISSIKKAQKIDIMPDIHLAFIEANLISKIPLIQRLDGIYYNSDSQYGDWWIQNKRITETYQRASGIIFQSQFSKNLVESFFGAKENTIVINNGVDINVINSIDQDISLNLSAFDNVWLSASSWRPHKRLNENIRYFLEHSANNDVMIVAGYVESKSIITHSRIIYVGECTREKLISLYHRAKYFVHLAYHDNCPNVVVDARAANCHIICASCSGTPEIAGLGATVIIEDEWDPAPVELYNPPLLDFTKQRINCIDSSIDIYNVTNRYIDFMRKFI